MQAEENPQKKAKIEGGLTTAAEGKMDLEVPAGRFDNWKMLLGRGTDFGGETGALKMEGLEFEADSELHDMISDACILCVGAGGLGCELLKDLALSGFKDIHVIDLDTIDVTNLNRQFLFRKKDVGQPKCTVAARFVTERVPGVSVTPHHGKLQDFEPEWYKQFQCVIAGLDNIEARRWLNETLCDLVEYDTDGSIKAESVIPLIDGGTEGLKGQARVILPTQTSCFECTMRLFPPNKGKPVCTLEANPRQPEDCAIYIFMKIEDNEPAEFSKGEQVFYNADNSPGGALGAIITANETELMEEAAEPTFTVQTVGGAEVTGVCKSNLTSLKGAWNSSFGNNARVDKDSREHMTWMHDRAMERATMFGITGLSYDKTMGSVKNIIPAVASTNAVIAAACVAEAVKCLSYTAQICNTYMTYNGQAMSSGIQSSTLTFERQPLCPACQTKKVIKADPKETVTAFANRLMADPSVLDLPDDMSLVFPVFQDSAGTAFFANAESPDAPIMAVVASMLESPLEEILDPMETVRIVDGTWANDQVRKIKVTFV